MARKPKSTPRVSLRERMAPLARQFRDLDTHDPSSWPVLPRGLLLLLVAALVVVLLWFLVLKNTNEQWRTAQDQEVQLRQQYQTKLKKAVSLDGLRQQREQVRQFVDLLEKQLPGKAEMDALLSDINQAGLGRSLQFDLFKPGNVAIKDYYAELPIAIKVTGRYHDIGAFAADIAHLSRIVTLNDLAVAPASDKDRIGDLLVLNATAKTFRYLDPEEIAAQEQARRAAEGKK